MDDFTAQFNNILVRAYHNVLLMEETKKTQPYDNFFLRQKRNGVSIQKRKR